MHSFTILILITSFSIASGITIQDYFAYPKYDLLFETGNISSLGSIEISSTISTCYIPKAESTDEVLIEEPDLGKAIEKISQIPCLYQLLEGKFWAYEFCSGTRINQFHPLPPNVSPGKDDVYILSIFNSKVKSYFRVENSEEGKLYHVVQEWTDGDICEITGKPRSTVVEYHCGMEESIVSMREITTCQYKLIVSTPKLCTDIAFVRQKPSMAIKIKCVPPSGIEFESPVGLETVVNMLQKKTSEKNSPFQELKHS